MENRPPRKILKSPVAKRRSRVIPKDQKVVLERVLGLTATTNASFACDPNTGTLAYPAGCVVVLYNPKKNKQTHIFNISKKTLTSVAFSGDGRHLITGESGHQPAVRVWDVAERVQVAEFHGHKFGISCVAFSPNLKYIVSIGTQHDMQVIVWNWRTGSKVASNKVSSKVSALAFSKDGSYFVTSGMRHVKFWYLDSSKSKINTTVPLNGRNGILGDHRNNFFCDVAVSEGRTFCVTQSGYLCQFNEKRQMDKWVELRTSCANCISVASDYIFVGCGDGIVRVFDATSLHFKVTLPRPHNLGVDIAAAISPSQITANKGSDIKYPDTMALKVDEEHRKVTCIYNDHSLYVWDVHDLKKIGKAWSHLYHSSCVYGVETYPALDLGQSPVLPPHSFFTCSSDDTIRIWNLDPHMPETPTYKSNIYSHELLKIMYMDPSLASLCDIDYNPSGAADKTDTNYDDKNGIRSIRVSPDGQHLASGDRQGNVRIHHLQHLDEVKQIEAHESEVLCLEYSNWSTGPKVLASASRDRLVHVYDTEQQYGLLQTLSDHSSSISAVKFTETDGELKMVTCGADKSILFRNLQQEPDFQFTLAHHLVEKMTLYDMDVEPSQKFAAIACQDRNLRIYNVKTGKKKKEYKGIYNVKTGKKKKEYKGSATDDGILLRMKLDPSGSYAVTSCSDKQLCIMDFYTGELLATMHGHSEIATDARFMNDLKHVISVSGDGCIFVWRLPMEMTTQMQTRLQEMGKFPTPLTNGNSKLALARHLRDEMDAAMGGDGSPGTTYISPQKVLLEINPDSRDNPDNMEVPREASPSVRETSLSPESQSDKQSPYYKFSVSQLPSWAKKQVEDGSSNMSPTDDSKSAYAPRGRWAQRVEGQGMAMKQQDGKSVEVDFATDRRRFTYDGDSPEVRRETMVLNRPSTTPRNMPVIYDDVPNDDDDDDAFQPLPSTTFIKHDKPAVNWEDLCSFDNDDGDQLDQTEIIYYPPSECDSSDTLPSSFQVFDTGVDRPARTRKSVSCSSNADGDSETTDPVSLEDMEEDEDSSHSTPSTPMEDVVPKTHNREKFLKDTFENLGFTPELSTDKFAKGLDTLEEELSSGSAPSFITARQSLSARFLSKSQAANIRNMGVYGSIQRQDNWFDSVQRRKDDMARNLDESRKMLMAMGWKQESPETDGEDPFPSPRSACDPAPAPKPGHNPLSPHKSGRNLSDVTDEDKTPTNRSFERSPLKKDPTQAMSTSNFAHNDHPGTPTSNKSSTSRPRTLQLDKADDKTRTKDKVTNKAQGRTSLTNRKATPTGPTPSVVAESKPKSSRLSLPYVSKPVVMDESRRRSAGSNLNKSKSNSMHSLEFAKEDTNVAANSVSSKPRSKWSTTKMASFASVPNLLFSDDDEDDGYKKPSSLRYSSDRTSSNPDLSEDSNSTGNSAGSRYSSNSKKSVKSDGGYSGSARALANRRTSSGVSENTTRRSSSTSRLSSGGGGGGSRSRDESLEERKGFVKKVGVSVSSVKKGERLGRDRDLMPPPAAAKVAKIKPETKFMKRAQQHGQPRRKTTSDLTLEQAKDILKGNSGILRTTSRGSRSSSSSPPNERVKVDTSVMPKSTVEDIGPITDPKLLNVASEIEMTAAELRRSSAPSSRHGPLEASPNDLPVRDTPPERDLRRSRAAQRSSDKPCDKSQTAMNVYPSSDTSVNRNNSVSDTDSVKHNSSCEDITRDSGLSTQEDDECPSPSVKDRIANLNKRVTNLQRKDDGLSSRERWRSQSPDSHRSTAKVNLSTVSPRSVSGVMSASMSSISSSTNSSSSNTTCVNSHLEINSLQSLSSSSISNEHSSVHNIPVDPHSIAMSRSGDDLSRSGDDPLSSSVSGSESQGMSSSTQSLSPPSRLTTGLTSEKLSHNTSPWTCHSNASPPSGGDTGVGSDTDTDLNGSLASSVFRKDDRDGAGDPVTCLQETMSQMEVLSRRAIHLYSQIQTRSDPRISGARTSCQDRLSAIMTSWCDNMGVASVHGNNSDSHHGNSTDMTTIPTDKLTQLFQKVNDLQTDMATLIGQNHGDR